MQSGDTVQVQQQDKGIHWIYATVITANADGSAFVQITHPGNIEHGAMKFFGAGKIRDKATLQKILAPPAEGQPETLSIAERRSLESQLNSLT